MIINFPCLRSEWYYCRSMEPSLIINICHWWSALHKASHKYWHWSENLFNLLVPHHSQMHKSNRWFVRYTHLSLHHTHTHTHLVRTRSHPSALRTALILSGIETQQVAENWVAADLLAAHPGCKTHVPAHAKGHSSTGLRSADCRGHLSPLNLMSCSSTEAEIV